MSSLAPRNAYRGTPANFVQHGPFKSALDECSKYTAQGARITIASILGNDAAWALRGKTTLDERPRFSPIFAGGTEAAVVVGLSSGGTTLNRAGNIWQWVYLVFSGEATWAHTDQHFEMKIYLGTRKLPEDRCWCDVAPLGTRTKWAEVEERRGKNDIVFPLASCIARR